MMELVNELLTTLVKLVVTAGGSYLIAYGLPWLKKIGLYKMVQILSLIHISEPTRRTPISYAVFCLKKKKKQRPRDVLLSRMP